MQLIDFLTGPVGAAFGFIIPMAGLILMIGLAAANLLVGLNDGARQLGSRLAAVMLTGFPIWLAAFYCSAFFAADFDGDWRGIAFCSVLAIFSLWLCSVALLGITRTFHGATPSED